MRTVKEKNEEVRENRFPPSLFVIFWVVLLLMSGIHTGLIVLINRMELNEWVQPVVPMVYWGIVAAMLTLFTRRKIREVYEEPMHRLAEATSQTPIAIIKNYAELLQSEQITEEQRKEYAESIEEASMRLSDLISNILKLNKLENCSGDRNL